MSADGDKVICVIHEFSFLCVEWLLVMHPGEVGDVVSHGCLFHLTKASVFQKNFGLCVFQHVFAYMVYSHEPFVTYCIPSISFVSQHAIFGACRPIPRSFRTLEAYIS